MEIEWREDKITNNRFPIMWEMGGNNGAIGFYQVIANKNGGKKKAWKLLREVNGKHAEIPVEKGDWIIIAKIFSGLIEIEIYRILKTVNELFVMPYYKYDITGWDSEPPEFLREAINVAEQGSKTFNLNYPLYYKLPEKFPIKIKKGKTQSKKEEINQIIFPLRSNYYDLHGEENGKK